MSNPTVLCIAGHGELPGGGFDPGATGYIKKGEHRYMEQDLFPAMKKFVPEGSKIVFYSKQNVLRHGNLVELAQSYGPDTIVIEFHYDAFTPNAEDGHVIIYGEFEPDSLDLRLRDVVKDMVGVRFAAYGQRGISARTNLGNANRAAKAGINYRLIELGFGTNKEEAAILVNRVEEYAKKLVEAILNTDVKGKPQEISKPVYKPQPVVNDDDKLQVNGKLDRPTIFALQKEFRTPQDGFISKPSMLIEAMQRWLGTPVDGFISEPNSKMVGALQAYLGTPADSRISEPYSEMVAEMQRRLIAGTLRKGTPKKAAAKKPNNVIKVGDKVRASRLYGSGADTTADRTKPITGYVDKIDNGWKNPYRLVKTKGKQDYLGFARKEHLSK